MIISAFVFVCFIIVYIANWGNFVPGKNVREYGNPHEFTPNTRSSSGAHTFAIFHRMRTRLIPLESG